MRAPWFFFLLDSTIPGGLMMVKLEAAARASDTPDLVLLSSTEHDVYIPKLVLEESAGTIKSPSAEHQHQ